MRLGLDGGDLWPLRFPFQYTLFLRVVIVTLFGKKLSDKLASSHCNYISVSDDCVRSVRKGNIGAHITNFTRLFIKVFIYNHRIASSTCHARRSTIQTCDPYLYQIYKRADGLQSKLASLMAAIFQLWTKLWYKVWGYHQVVVLLVFLQQGLSLLVLICLEIHSQPN